MNRPVPGGIGNGSGPSGGGTAAESTSQMFQSCGPVGLAVWAAA